MLEQQHQCVHIHGHTKTSAHGRFQLHFPSASPTLIVPTCSWPSIGLRWPWSANILTSIISLYHAYLMFRQPQSCMWNYFKKMCTSAGLILVLVEGDPLPHRDFQNMVGNLTKATTTKIFLKFITHAPLFQGGEDYVCESPLGDSSFVMNIYNPFMHCAMSQYVFKLRDVIMLLHAVTMVTT